jgi:2'-5' RNA ligase
VDLFGFEAPPPRLKRPRGPREGHCQLFFALFPQEDAIAQMLAVGREAKTGLRLTGDLQRADRLHLTLDHLGDFKSPPEEIVQTAGAAAAQLAAQYNSFPVCLDRMLSFQRGAKKHPLVLKDSGEANPVLRDFRASLWDALATRAVPGESRSAFTPHVTLMYDVQALAEKPVPGIAWQAQEFLLIHSAIGERRYEVLGRWPFSASAVF